MPWPDLAERVAGANLRAFGRAATYTPRGGAGTAVTVILDQPTERKPLGLVGAVGPALAVSVRLAEVPQPRKDDRVTVAGIGYRVETVDIEPDGTIAVLGLVRP